MIIDKFFAILKDGAWHNINELSTTLEVSSSKLKEFSEFLEEKKVIKYDRDADRIKIEDEWKTPLPGKEWEKKLEKTGRPRPSEKQELTIKA